MSSAAAGPGSGGAGTAIRSTRSQSRGDAVERVGLDAVGAVAAQQLVGLAVAGAQHVVARSAVEPVAAEAAVERVGPARAGERVVGRAAGEPVAALAGREPVRAVAAQQHVGRRAAGEVVGAGAAAQLGGHGDGRAVLAVAERGHDARGAAADLDDVERALVDVGGAAGTGVDAARHRLVAEHDRAARRADGQSS